MTNGMFFAVDNYIENLANPIQQLCLANWLHQIRGNAQFSTACGVTEVADRLEHHDGHGEQARVLLNLFSQCKAVHVWHLTVQQDELEGEASAPGDLECLQCGPVVRESAMQFRAIFSGVSACHYRCE